MTKSPDMTCPRILIVDDDPDHCRLLGEALAMYFNMDDPDSEIRPVFSGRDCLALTLKNFDIILLDLHLPDMTGLNVLDEILARADVPVIFVTGENDLAVAAEAIERGAQDYVVKHGDYLFAIPVIVQKNLSLHRIKLDRDRLQLKLQWMLEELQSKNRQLEESMKKLETMATTDPLTGLANRRYFNEQLAHQFDQAVRYSTDLSCCMIDLDHYKRFNDTLGHQMGDELLQVTGREIRAALRAADLPARYGGDEFVLLLPQTSTDEALAVTNRIRDRMANEFRSDKRLWIPVTLSIGIASLRADTPPSAERLVTLADRALYHAKELGRDQIVVFSEITSPHHACR